MRLNHCLNVLAAVGQLASGIAHDFNNLLTTIILYVQMVLSDPRLPSDLAQSLLVVISESRQATQLVQQMLDFSRRAPMEVRVYLPALSGEAPAPKRAAEAPLLLGRGETVLLVEDRPALRAAGRKILEQLGYRVLEAAEGREALEVYAAEQVDLVLTAVVMPEMSGAALVEALRQQTPDLKVIAITGYGEDQEVERIRQAGVLEVIRKPFEVECLAAVIRRVLG